MNMVRGRGFFFNPSPKGFKNTYFRNSKKVNSLSLEGKGVAVYQIPPPTPLYSIYISKDVSPRFSASSFYKELIETRPNVKYTKQK